MARGDLRQEERTGLMVALGLHGLVLAALLMQPAVREAIPVPERMTVSLAEEVGLEAAAPEPVAESRAAIAPTLSDERGPAPQDVAPPLPARVQSPVPAPAKPAPAKPAAKPASKPAASKAGGSRLGDNFLDGQGDSTSTTETRVPASRIGAAEVASIKQALIRQIKPKWSAPQGVEVDQIVTLLDFDLNEDGSLKGRPRIRSQSGETDANRAQMGPHGERAIRAVQLAAPFDLPAKYYNAWKSIRGARFDRSLSQ